VVEGKVHFIDTMEYSGSLYLMCDNTDFYYQFYSSLFTH